MRSLIGGLLLTSVAACTTNAAAGKAREQLDRELAVLAAKCSPAGKLQFELVGTTRLRIWPSPSASYEEVDCFLAGIRSYRFDLGFVGIETYKWP